MSGGLRLGLIGCGRLAELGYAPAIASSEAVRLVAVADPSPARRSALASLTGARAFAGAGELIADAGVGVDAVVIASPAVEHLDQARQAAGAALPCLVEKPPALDAAAARELAALDPAPWVGFNRRFQQGLELAGACSGDAPLELELELRYRRASWAAHQVRDDALLDLGPHLVDLALLLGGGPGRVRAAACEPERAEIELETARGPALIRCATDRPHLERVLVRRPGIRGPARSVSGGHLRGAIARLRRPAHPLVGSLTRQLDAFAAAARGGEGGLLASAGEGARVIELIEQARGIAAPGARPESLTGAR